MTGFAGAIQQGFVHCFDFRGRASRSEFWFFMLFFLLAYLVVWLIDHFLLEPTLDLRTLPGARLLPSGYIDPRVGILVLAYRPIMAIPTASVTVRRLHDVGKSGWWGVLWVLPVPILGWFWLLPWLARESHHEEGDA